MFFNLFAALSAVNAGHRYAGIRFLSVSRRAWLFGVVSALSLLSATVSAQVSTRRVRELVNVVADKVEEDDTDQIYMIEIDYVEKDGTSSQTYSVSAGTRYRVVAVGDNNRIKDLDLYVLDPYGNEVVRDADNKNVASVTFRPVSSGSYKFRVKPYAMASGANDGFYGLVISRIR